ncbi:hypothetical protein L218DRAFT_960828 [Marasmius fiardii PR-910]|nr:hypothetical protein L218DRAFT_960828 [Marasmius fiardii PR-910]
MTEQQRDVVCRRRWMEGSGMGFEALLRGRMGAVLDTTEAEYGTLQSLYTFNNPGSRGYRRM